MSSEKLSKLEKMMLKSSESCQRCIVVDRLVVLAAAGHETDRTDQASSASVLVGAAQGSR